MGSIGEITSFEPFERFSFTQLGCCCLIGQEIGNESATSRRLHKGDFGICNNSVYPVPIYTTVLFAAT
jgi:hypothetical protein